MRCNVTCIDVLRFVAILALPVLCVFDLHFHNFAFLKTTIMIGKTAKMRKACHKKPCLRKIREWAGILTVFLSEKKMSSTLS